MISQDLLEILRCPNCVREKDGLLTLHKDTWLICQDCDRKYPIVDGRGQVDQRVCGGTSHSPSL